MSRKAHLNPWASSALARARQLVRDAREPEAYESLGTALKAAGWFQPIAWGRVNNSPGSLWQRWVELYCERDLILFRMIVEERHQWIDAWDEWKRTTAELVEQVDRSFHLGPQRWRTGRKPSRRMTLQDELTVIHRAAGHEVRR